MIITFYDRNFNALLNNASLVIDNESYQLIKRPIELNDFTCICEPFTENIQPTFLVVKDDKGSSNLIYSSLAGVPLLNEENKTEINGTDLKIMFDSDILVNKKTYTNVNNYILSLFEIWQEQVNNNSINCELIFNDYVNIDFTDLKPAQENAYENYNFLQELQSYLQFYNLYIDSKIDLINKKVIFTIGEMMLQDMNIKLWEYGIRNYGKYIADVNTIQGIFLTDGGVPTYGYTWILTSNNEITIDDTKRDIYPIKKKNVINSNSKDEANSEALKELLNSRFNENIDIIPTTSNINFETKFNVYLRQGEGLYKSLPCGELEYNANGLNRLQIGFRYAGIDLI